MDEQWGVYETECRQCGRGIIVVATVDSVENGYAEAFENGTPLCLICSDMHLLGKN
jgi:hypothetical protein